MLTLLVCDAIALWAAGPLAMFLVLSSPIALSMLLLAVNSAVGLVGAVEDRKRGARDLWLEAGRCASCGYPLGQEQSDRCVTCAECGAAWLLPVPCTQAIVVLRSGERRVDSIAGVVAGDVSAHDHGPYRIAAEFVREFPVIGEPEQDKVRPLAG